MSDKTNLKADLDKLVKRAAAIKAEALKPEIKKASIGDDVDDKTRPASTGEQAAANRAANQDINHAAMVDKGAKPNQSNASLENHVSTGAAAADAAGQAGSTGGVLAVKETRPNTSSDGVFKEAADLVAALRKAAEEAVAADSKKPADAGDDARLVQPGVDRKPADAKPEETKPLTVGGAKAETETAKVEEKTATAKPEEKKVEKTAAERIRGFLGQAAMTNPNVKTAAEAEQMGAEQVGDAAGDSLLQAIESGQLSEQEAAQILQEALASGAITEEEVAAVMQEAAAAAPAEGAPAGDPAAMDPAQAKIAAAHIGPDHPEYLAKLAALYPEYEQFGAELALKLAEELAAAAPEDKAKAHEGKETPAEEAKEHAMGGLEATTPEEKAALEKAKQELGLSDADLKALIEAPAPPAADVKVAQYRAAILTKAAALKAEK